MLQQENKLIKYEVTQCNNERITTPEDSNHDRHGKIKELMVLLVARWQDGNLPTTQQLVLYLCPESHAISL